MDISWWSSPEQVSGTAVRTAFVYLFTVVAVRLAGRRTLARMSAFDTVVTVALGSLAASTALPSNAALSDFVAVLMTFLVLQVLIAALRQRLPQFQRLIDFPPLTIVRDGQVDLRSAPWSAQLTRSDLDSRLRQNGIGELDDAKLVVLESTGEISTTKDLSPPSLFQKVES